MENSRGGRQSADCGDCYLGAAEFYDWVPPYRQRPDVPFFTDLAAECGGPVLELGCGSGRVLIPTAKAGMEITGLDISPSMLDAARRRLNQESLGVRARTQLIQGSMSSFSLGRKFKLVTVPFRAFQHLTETSQQLACLKCAFDHLELKGRIVLDLFNPSLEALLDKSRGEEYGHEPEFVMPDGRRVARSMRNPSVDLANQIIDCEIIYGVTHADGRKERRVQAFKMRYLFRFEAEHLLARSGFQIEAVYGGYDRSAFGSEWPGELICVGRKG